MLVEVTFERKGLAATAAHERLGRRVGLDVGPEVGLVRERLRALAALERFLACVRANVSL